MSGLAIHTLGCKINFYESAALENACRRVLGAADAGVGNDGTRPPVIVVNTCAVTARAGMQSRQLIRRLHRRHPDALLVVTGCYAQLAPDEVAAIPGVAAVVGNPGKERLVAWLAGRLSSSAPTSSGLISACLSSPPSSPLPAGSPAPAVVAAPECFGFTGELPVAALRAAGFGDRARAFLKVQDGCDSFCRYCIIPRLRGRPRSMPPGPAAAEAVGLAAAGFREIVLTGVHLGCYGVDLEPRTSLEELVDRLREAVPGVRLRLGSLQPPEITPQLLERIAAPDSGVCAHLHLSLQSGDDRVLAAMGRPYGSAAVTALMTDLVRRAPRVTVGADVICGFPGETDAAFAATRALVRDLPFAYLHVFPWSSRPGTPAAEMSGQVPEGVRTSRAKQLVELGKQKKLECYKKNLMHCMNVLVERVQACGAAADGPVWQAVGRSDNYLPVAVEGCREGIENLVGRMIEVMSRELGDGIMRAQLC
ncbi:MAG: tRNA (N(6)-L-threonylcarbamoyladenosine(37)-C(2))-methylthiotransferase MtaB [Deltaproteobacteria bacterium]|nr:tRNA (N(6)-L-threonylcarbamoyladenosine(37)-C(2))-methylthiotransferase MtaB [Candidatus Anaeroferrophillacea bacterium]